MNIDERQQQTTVNVQEKANLIWAIADKLVGVYKPHEYGNVILPMCVIKRFEDTLAPTREKVLETNRELEEKKIEMKRGFLERGVLEEGVLSEESQRDCLHQNRTGRHESHLGRLRLPDSLSEAPEIL